jgi:type II secretory pathway pseudopilin PulG
LIVIAVIGILAAITIVAFNGVSNRAKVALVTSDLDAVSKKLIIDQTINGGYPATLAATDGGKGVPASAGTTYQYTVDNTANPQTFCVTAVNGSTVYYINESGTPTTGTCAGHSSTGYTTPAIGGYTDLTPIFSAATSLTISPFGSVPDGAWMIIVLAYTNTTAPTTPAGWTTLISYDHTGSMSTSVYAKIKTSSDTGSMTITLNSAGNTASGAFMWGTSADAVSSWTLGSIGKRDGTTGQQYITTTPTVTTTAVQSLVLSISNERTIATEADITSLTGATKWFFIAQPDANKLQTITLSYAALNSVGTSTPVTVTYPNPQTLNGIAFQIALPPFHQ